MKLTPITPLGSPSQREWRALRSPTNPFPWELALGGSGGPRLTTRPPTNAPIRGIGVEAFRRPGAHDQRMGSVGCKSWGAPVPPGSRPGTPPEKTSSSSARRRCWGKSRIANLHAPRIFNVGPSFLAVEAMLLGDSLCAPCAPMAIVLGHPGCYVQWEEGMAHSWLAIKNGKSLYP